MMKIYKKTAMEMLTGVITASTLNIMMLIKIQIMTISLTVITIKVTEFDWNGNGNADWGDHSVHAEQLANFYRLMFSHEVMYEEDRYDNW